MVRDDIIEYSLEGHHSEEAGVGIRKKIWKVTAILSIVTIVEVLVGVFFPKASVSDWAWFSIKMMYIALTIVKAGYIVLVFMHLGDERKALRRMVIWPYTVFILYLVMILWLESSYINEAWQLFK